jgi:ABC-2 type transport system permease protein
MNLIYAYSKIYTLQLFRNRSSAFFQIFFPVILVLVFGRHAHGTEIAQTAVLIVFANYAVQTSTFLSLGLSVSAERSSNWTIYLKTLPAKHSVQFAGLIISKLVAAVISLTLVVLGCFFILDLNVSIPLLLFIFLVAFLGGIPMSLLGIGMGNIVNAQAARGVMVFINLSLLFATFAFPDKGWLSILREFIPSYQWMMITLSHIIKKQNEITPWLWMLGWTLVIYLFALWSHRRKRDLRHS